MRIRVPATSANVGPGFDCLGIAFNLINTFDVELSDTFEIRNTPSDFQNEDNLFLKAYRSTFPTDATPITVTFDTNVPISRGLGSSATLTIGGIVAGFLVQNKEMDVNGILHYATKIEGHPDNVAPALLGGLVASYQTTYQPLELHPSWQFYLLIPDVEVSTSQARAILPNAYPRQVAVSNSAKAILLIEALRHGNLDLLKVAADDAIHEPYRKTLIPAFDTIKEICTSDGKGVFFISGSGSTCLSIRKEPFSPQQLQELSNYPSWNVQDVKVCTEGTTLEDKAIWQPSI